MYITKKIDRTIALVFGKFPFFYFSTSLERFMAYTFGKIILWVGILDSYFLSAALIRFVYTDTVPENTDNAIGMLMWGPFCIVAMSVVALVFFSKLRSRASWASLWSIGCMQAFMHTIIGTREFFLYGSIITGVVMWIAVYSYHTPFKRRKAMY